jgi:hypothetical protein
MRTKLLIAAGCLLMVAAASAQQSKPATPAEPLASVLEAKSRKSWEEFKNKDKAGFATELADGFRAVEDDGAGARDAKAEVAEIDDFELSQYTLKDFHITPLGASAALVTYMAEYSGTAGGQPVHGKVAVAEVWVKRDSDWKTLYSQDTNVK